MKKILFVVAATAVIVAGLFYLYNLSKISYDIVEPELLYVSSSEVTIAWISDTQYRGRVNYQPLSGTETYSATEAIGVSRKHEVVLKGLAPATHYKYWIGTAQTQFQFQTQPSTVTPFSFLMVWGDVSRQLYSLVNSDMPSFIFDLNPTSENADDPFASARPFVPVYNLVGVNSKYLRSINAVTSASSTGFWNMDWGGLRLTMIQELTNKELIADKISGKATNVRGILSAEKLLDISQIDDESFEEQLKNSQLYSFVQLYNKNNPEKKVDFVAIAGRYKNSFVFGDVTFMIIPVSNKDMDRGIIRFEIGVETASAVDIDADQEITLKQTLIDKQRTCAECRRLADMGAYEESIQAYKDFIKTNQGHFQIDDAYFAIAEILDEKLFRIEEALSWYQSLIETYPQSTLTPLANQRVKYIREYSDFDYKPLARFEFIKKVEIARKKNNPDELKKVLEETENIVDEYPASKLAPVMRFWLANQYRSILPDKAIASFLLLKKEFPDYPGAKDALFEIGQIYYENKQYHKAIEIYTEALQAYPSQEKTILGQISRSNRNIRRDQIMLSCWAVFIIWITGGLVIKPFGFEMKRIKRSVIGFIFLTMILLVAAWLIHEQFTSVVNMIAMVLVFSALASFGSLISTAFVEKIFRMIKINIPTSNQIILAASNTISGLIFFTGGFYLAVYYIYVHFLVVFKL